MKELRAIDAREALGAFKHPDEAAIDALLAEKLASFDRKIVVLDDDPTGVQTVHDIYVYTDWRAETLREAFAAPERMFFILTNSRGMTAAESRRQHEIIAENVAAASRESGKDYVLISRSDSTLRGHYPLETETLRSVIERKSAKRFDGEIIFPFFREGGRFTIGDVHYVREGDKLVPAGMTEFARDKSFGYRSSDLREWCEEKTSGRFRAEDVISISLDELRGMRTHEIAEKLKTVRGFNKVIVNSIDYCDVKVFALAYLEAVQAGREFMFRSAAAVTKVLGAVPDQPLLRRADLVTEGSEAGGLIVVGSHVNKTSRQLERLRSCRYPIEFIEFDQHRVLVEGGLEAERDRVVALTEKAISEGRTAAVYTRRERLDLDTADADRQLEVSLKISDAVTGIISGLSTRPSFIIAKGGITSSEIGTKALKVRRALVKGQVRPGIPVWQTGEESKFADMPYIIFPGNVGTEDDLKDIVEALMEKKQDK